MRLLVLGGTVFLGRAVARQALAAGHDVTCAARGSSGKPVDGVRFVQVDRDDPRGLDAVDGNFDAVVDVSRRPSHVQHAVMSLAGRSGHMTFVSTISVYSDTTTPGQRVDTSPVLEAARPGFDDPTADAEAYGRCKVRCEQLVIDAFGADDVFVCRAGLLVGPEDPIGRFAYWLRRSVRGGEVLVPGTPEDHVQLVDVRDLAAWIVTAAERRLSGTYDGVAPAITRRQFVEAILGDRSAPVYVPPAFLLEHHVEPWHGPRSVPMWLTELDAGLLSRAVSASVAAGLHPRPLADTVRDTIAWMTSETVTTGLTDDEERELLAAWHASRA